MQEEREEMKPISNCMHNCILCNYADFINAYFMSEMSSHEQAITGSGPGDQRSLYVD